MKNHTLVLFITVLILKLFQTSAQCVSGSSVYVSNVTPNSAEINWTDTVTSSGWVVELTDLRDFSTKKFETTNSIYEIKNLIGESQYNVCVYSATCSSPIGEFVRFNTLETCDLPLTINSRLKVSDDAPARGGDLRDVKTIISWPTTSSLASYEYKYFLKSELEFAESYEIKKTDKSSLEFDLDYSKEYIFQLRKTCITTSSEWNNYEVDLTNEYVSNDDCENATELLSLPYQNRQYIGYPQTDSLSELNNAGYYVLGDRFYKFESNTDGLISFNFISYNITLVGVVIFDGGCENLSILDAAFDSRAGDIENPNGKAEVVAFNIEKDKTYYIAGYSLSADFVSNSDVELNVYGNIILSNSDNEDLKNHVNPNVITEKGYLQKASDWVLTNQYGKVITQGSGIEIDLSSFKSGLYFLKLDQKVERIIKL